MQEPRVWVSFLPSQEEELSWVVHLSPVEKECWKGQRPDPVTCFNSFPASFIIMVLERGNRSLTRVNTVLHRGYLSPTEGSCFIFFLILYLFHHIFRLYSLYFFIIMSPALLKSFLWLRYGVQIEQCAPAITHLLSFSCTSCFYNISYMFVILVNA